MKQETGILEASTALKADQLSRCILKNISANSVLGISFGMEDDPEIKRRISLVTLYSKKFSGIFRLDRLGSMPDSLKRILECCTIVKVGINCADLAGYLKEDYSVDLTGFLDIRHLTSKTLDLTKSLPLTKLILGIQENPGAGHQLTNIQILQASKDAQYSYEVFQAVCTKMSKPNPTKWEILGSFGKFINKIY